jgi:hypothetical protein
MIIRKPLLAFLGALLILVQSLFAVEVNIPVDDAYDHPHPLEVKVKQEISSQSTYLEASSRVTFTTATFLLLWISKLFNFPQVSVNTFKHYKAFFGHAYIFNTYYTCLSALAP